MAAATLLDGPDARGFPGLWKVGGYNGYVQQGRGAFPTTATTCTIPLFNGGIAKKPQNFIQYDVVDKTVVVTFNADYSIATLTRTDTTSAAQFSYLFIWQ